MILIQIQCSLRYYICKGWYVIHCTYIDSSFFFVVALLTSGLCDLPDVQKELISVSAKWMSIGIALRLDPNFLDGIQTKNSGDPSTCLSSMLKEWLKENYTVKDFRRPTWKWLVDAVGNPEGGNHTALAREIARRHKAQTGL